VIKWNAIGNRASEKQRNNTLFKLVGFLQGLSGQRIKNILYSAEQERDLLTSDETPTVI